MCGPRMDTLNIVVYLLGSVFSGLNSAEVLVFINQLFINRSNKTAFQKTTSLNQKLETNKR